jgi:hypothetical protein
MGKDKKIDITHRLLLETTENVDTKRIVEIVKFNNGDGEGEDKSEYGIAFHTWRDGDDKEPRVVRIKLSKIGIHMLKAAVNSIVDSEFLYVYNENEGDNEGE